jgi:DNA/RNA-binding domain of Phe-tRNA-synthetase-like protein
MLTINISPEFAERISGYQLIQIEADVVNADTPEELSREIDLYGESIKEVMEIADINKRPAIKANREAYKALGKDPNRYRPSQEQMSRRLLKGLGLYRVNALVDLGNLLSLKTGNSLGIFDRDKIVGDTLTLGVGREGEPYEGIGRGELNIANLPVVRDAVGGIATPTSDNVRTATSLSTRHILVAIHCYALEMALSDIVAEAHRLLTTYADCQNFEYRIIS